VLVCGSAYSLFPDLYKAAVVFPGVPRIAVKGASGFIKSSILFGLHPGKLDGMREAQLKFHSDFTVHTAGDIEDFNRFGKAKTGSYDCHWGDLGGGCSGWSGVKMALKMGFDQVVMCGIPLEKGGYSDGMFSKHFQTQKIIDRYRGHVLKDSEIHPQVISMSGWTREILGDHFILDGKTSSM